MYSALKSALLLLYVGENSMLFGRKLIEKRVINCKQKTPLQKHHTYVQFVYVNSPEIHILLTMYEYMYFIE